MTDPHPSGPARTALIERAAQAYWNNDETWPRVHERDRVDIRWRVTPVVEALIPPGAVTLDPAAVAAVRDVTDFAEAALDGSTLYVGVNTTLRQSLAAVRAELDPGVGEGA